MNKQLSMFDDPHTLTMCSYESINAKKLSDVMQAYLAQIRLAIPRQYVIYSISKEHQTSRAGLRPIEACVHTNARNEYTKQEVLMMCTESVVKAQTALLKDLIYQIKRNIRYSVENRWFEGTCDNILYDHESLDYIARLTDEDSLAWLTNQTEKYLAENITLCYHTPWTWLPAPKGKIVFDETRLFLTFYVTFEITKNLLRDYIMYAKSIYLRDASRRFEGKMPRARRHYTWETILKRKQEKVKI